MEQKIFFIFLFLFFNYIHEKVDTYLVNIDLFNNLNFFINFKLFLVEEIVIIFLFYNFIKVLIFGSLLELI